MLGGPRETRSFSIFLGHWTLLVELVNSLRRRIIVRKRGDGESCGRDVRVQTRRRVRTGSREYEGY